MGVHTWAYEPEKCDGDYCPCNCDVCSKAEIDEEHIPIDLASTMLKNRFKEQSDG